MCACHTALGTCWLCVLASGPVSSVLVTKGSSVCLPDAAKAVSPTFSVCCHWNRDKDRYWDVCDTFEEYVTRPAVLCKDSSATEYE